MFISLDLETTGFDANDDEIIEFGAIKFDLNGGKEEMQFLCNPNRPIPQIVTFITNIHDDDVKNTAPFADRKQEVLNFIGDLPIVGHNIQFDTTFLRAKGLDLKNREYDTHEFAGFVLPDMPSYSLEILAQELKLTHVDQHRALDDAIAAMHLFLKLTEEFQKFPAELIEEMQKLVQKSDWDLKHFLKTLKHSEKADSTPHKAEIATPSPEQAKIISEISQSSSPTLFQVNKPYDQLSLQLSQNVDKISYIAIPQPLFHKIHKNIPENIAVIDNTRNYLSLKRLEEFKQQEHFEDFEIIALLKYLCWSKHTNSGLIDELRLVNKEFKTRVKVNIDESISDPNTEHFYAKAQEKDQENPAICTHQFLIENPPQNAKVTIVDLEQFLISLHNNRSTFIKLEQLENSLDNLKKYSPEITEKLKDKVTILFGIIGMIFQKTNDNSPYTPRSSITPDILNSADWLKAKDAVANLIEISKEFGEIKATSNLGLLQSWKKQLGMLHEIFFSPDLDDNLIWIEKDYKEQIVLRQMAKNTHKIFNKLLENFNNHTIIGENLDLNDQGQFTKTLAGLPAEMPLKNLSTPINNLEINVVKDTNYQDQHQIPNALIEHFKAKPGRAAVILNSKQQLNFFTVKLNQAGINVISQLTSSTGKLQAKYKAESDTAVLLTTPHIWNKIDCHHLVDTVFLTKLPFDPPSAAHIVALSQNYRDPFNQLQIPRAVINLQKILKKLAQDPASKRAILLDGRILTKNYGKQFLDSLQSLADIKSITLQEI
jgi:DNA polymerase III epsilon subunit family exonuclease